MKSFSPFLTVITCMVLFFLMVLPGRCQQAENPFVFRVTASGIANTSKGRVLTGFRVAGVPGIVTALHGVGDARVISARNASYSFPNLRIRVLNIGKDLAILTCPELEGLPKDGFSIGVTPPASASIQLIGHPYGISQSPSTYSIRRSSMLLEKLIPQDERSKEIRKRESPDVSTTLVVDLQAAVVPGLSGAPVLHNSKVFAIADGGLNDGDTNYTWAIPISSETLTTMPVASPALLAKASTLPSVKMLDHDEVGVPPVLPCSDSKEDTGGVIGEKHYARTTFTIDKSGVITGETRIRNDDAADGFCMSTGLCFFDEAGQLITTKALGSSFCVVSGFEYQAYKLLGKPAQIDRTVPFEAKVNPDILSYTYRIAIIHRPEQKYPFEQLSNQKDLLNLLFNATKDLLRP